jgi:hypothetical protein
MAAGAGKDMKKLISAVCAVAVVSLAPQSASKSRVPPVAEGSAAVEQTPARFIPFGVGERMDYQIKFKGVSLGKGAIEVMKLEAIRGRPAWHVQLRLDAKVILLYSLESVLSSWIDTATLHSLRFVSDQEERGKPRDRYFDIFPEKSTYRQKITPDTMPELPSVPDPLDDASFLYFIRTTPLEVGQTYTYQRYFRPDRNPVTIKVLGKEQVSVPLGNFPAIVIQPTIKTSGMFSEGGKAKIWLSDDPLRLILKLESEVAAIVGSLHLNLTNYTAPRTRGR